MNDWRTEAVDARAAAVYLQKAEEFLAAAETALADRRWNAAGLDAVHAGISFADAVLAHTVNVRSRETDHSAVVAILGKRVAEFGNASRRQLVGLLRNKRSVEYEDRLTTEVEAKQMVDSARRFGKWATGVCS